MLTAEGRLFCAGGDVREMATANDRQAFLHELAETMYKALISLRALSTPVIAASRTPRPAQASG